MNKDIANKLAHELTLEYIKKQPHLLSSNSIEDIPKMVDEVADIQQKFYDAILFHKVLDKLY